LNAKLPSAFTWTDRVMFLDVSVTVTVSPPEDPLTLPAIAPVVVWANELDAPRIKADATSEPVKN
jgi:hypothetical protein